MTKSAGILTIGSELVSGERLDTNAHWLSQRLGALGIPTLAHRSCDDDLGAIARDLRQLAEHHDLLLVTGGLGPTSDDLTRDAIAQLLDVPLELHAPSLAAIEARFAAFNRVMPPSNRRQAELPKGARVLENPRGTAPAFHVSFQSTEIYVLPGVPGEVRALWDHHLQRTLSAVGGTPHHEWPIRSVGISESALGERLDALLDDSVHVRYTVESDLGTILVTFSSPDLPALDALKPKVRDALARHLAAEDGQTLAEDLAARLLAAGRTVSTAESCTGGRVAAAITSVPGVSAVFHQSFVTYSNDAKVRLLGVPQDTLDRVGAVARETAEAMARGVQRAADADYGLGVTGIAGPDGGSPEKPVGLVHFAVATRTGGLTHLERRFPGDRRLVQNLATAAGLALLRDALLDELAALAE